VQKIRDRIQNNIIIDSDTGCWNWKGKPRKNGYCRTHFMRVCEYVHRMSYLTFVGTIPEGMDVRHKCDNRRCCNPDHLLIGTRLQNMQDAVSRNRQARGLSLPQTKLTADDIVVIMNRVLTGEPYKNIAQDFNVTPQLIGKHAIQQGVRRYERK
jgi:hypothetical protein